MIQFLTTPIFYLTPYIFIWSLLNGLITVGLLKLWKFQVSRRALIVSGVTAALACILWNWSIAFNQSTIYLNVDAPIFHISWADFFDGVCVFALTSLALGLWAGKGEKAELIARVAGLAALVTIIADTFFF